jgi:hydroxymethylpyrimidine pyrophosphatase-like HAD family hydrolase
LQIDPAGNHFRIEDTGKDIEINLTIDQDSDEENLRQKKATQRKDFDKGDGLLFLNKQLHLRLSDGNNLVCGDTASDIPMAERIFALNPETKVILVTREEDLKTKVRSVIPQCYFVPEPDILVTALYIASKGK